MEIYQKQQQQHLWYFKHFLFSAVFRAHAERILHMLYPMLTAYFLIRLWRKNFRI